MFFFFFNDTATTEIYTLSLHDALPISVGRGAAGGAGRSLPPYPDPPARGRTAVRPRDRKSTRLNSSHVAISYAVFCLKKKNRIRNFYRHFQCNILTYYPVHSLYNHTIK